jgi:hypothetical protein
VSAQVASQQSLILPLTELSLMDWIGESTHKLVKVSFPLEQNKVISKPAKLLRRLPLVNCLRELKPAEASVLVAVIAQGVSFGVKSGDISISLAEKIIFNLDILLFCKKELKDRAARTIIETGMELEDVESLVQDPKAIGRACDNILKLCGKVLSNKTRL